MAQMTITSAFETLKAQRELSGQTIVLDEFVLAYIPGLDPSLPIDRKEGLPSSEQIVFTADVTQSGFVNPNAVIYSLIMDTSVGDFEFNWIGLRNKEHGVLAAISHIPVINKIQSIPGVKNGNSVTRSMMMSYTGAKEATGITVDASTWQIDFTARLSGMDEVERLANIDHYGDAAFLDNGYQVFKSGSSYKVKQGTGYVGGLRCHAPAALSVSGAGKSMGIYLDASWQGGLTSEWQTVVSIKASAPVLTDYVDSSGLQHYVTKLAYIDNVGDVIDQRSLGGTPAFERRDNAAKNADIDSDSTSEKHVKLPQFWRGINKKVTTAFNGRQVNTTGALQGGGALSVNRTLSIKDATTSQKGAVQLTDSVTSTSSSLGATAKAVKTAYDKTVSVESNANKAIATKLDKTATAVNSAKFEGKTKAQVITEARAGLSPNTWRPVSDSVTSTSKTTSASCLAVKTSHGRAVAAETNAKNHANNVAATKLDKTATAVNSAKLEGKTKAQVVAEARSGLSPNTHRPVSDSVTSTSQSTSASSRAVKTAFDKAVQALNVASQGLPTGIPMPWPKATPPTGWLECRGQTFNKGTYPGLAIAYPSGRLPDLRGEFIRGWDHGRGADAGRGILSSQGDAIRNITGTLGSPTNEGSGLADGAFRVKSIYGQRAGAGGARAITWDFDASRVVPTASENRVRNIAFMFIVRAA